MNEAKIISYNVNGIRAAMNKGLMEWLETVSPDIFCVQEIKALEEQIDLLAFRELGYNYNYIHPAQKKGYSGVAIFSKHEPKRVEVGSKIKYMDDEGRVIRLDFDNFSVISLYAPSGTNMDRLDFKLQFYEDFLSYIKELKKTIPNLVICGDYNVCHQEIDIHDPVRNKTVSGFLPEEREWFGRFLNDCNMIDTFRHFNQEPHHYSWWSYRAGARQNNKGWRIDYHLAGNSLKHNLSNAYILPDAIHSDHCPIVLELKF